MHATLVQTKTGALADICDRISSIMYCVHVLYYILGNIIKAVTERESASV